MIIDLGPLTIKLDVLLVQLINIGILFYIFKKLFADTIIKEIEDRRAMTQKLEQANKEYTSLLAEAEAKKEEIINEALAHKKSVVAESVDLAKQERDKILEKAHREAELIVEKTNQETASQQRDFEAQFEGGVKRTALAMVKKLFTDHPSVSHDYVQWLANEFEQSYKS